MTIEFNSKVAHCLDTAEEVEKEEAESIAAFLGQIDHESTIETVSTQHARNASGADASVNKSRAISQREANGPDSLNRPATNISDK